MKVYRIDGGWRVCESSDSKDRCVDFKSRSLMLEYLDKVTKQDEPKEIERIDAKQLDERFGTSNYKPDGVDLQICFNKINELVEAVNELRSK